jgi:HSP20 family molecular chaperone IbpA
MAAPMLSAKAPSPEVFEEKEELVVKADLPVKSEQIKANFNDGVLEVRMSKTEEAKKKSVSVKID